MYSLSMNTSSSIFTVVFVASVTVISNPLLLIPFAGIPSIIGLDLSIVNVTSVLFPASSVTTNV